MNDPFANYERDLVPEHLSGRVEVLNLPVNLDSKCVFQKPLADRSDHITRQSSLLYLACRTVGEGKRQHFRHRRFRAADGL